MRESSPTPRAPVNPGIDLVVLDLDGTILDPHHDVPLSRRVVETVRAVQARGIRVTLATGRTLEYALPLARELDLEVPLITSQGAVLADARTGRVLRETCIPEAAARQARLWAASAGERVVALYYSPFEIVQTREVEAGAIYDHLFGKPRRISPDGGPSSPQAGLVKFIVVNEPDLQPELQVRFAPAISISRTHHRLVEGTAAGVNKGSGLAGLLSLLEIEPARVLAVGDNENDLPVFQQVGLAVAMGDADARVQAAAHWVAPTIREDGAAVALERFLL